MKNIVGGVTSAKGFEAAAVEAGIKYQNRKDMAMIFSSTPCKAAGVFTTNQVKAACVIWDKEIVASNEPVHAVVVNAGIANACTGKQGYEYCKDTALAAAEALTINENAVLLASTGVIGKQLPIEKIKNGVSKLSTNLQNTYEAGNLAAEAIMTTDTVSKQVAVTFEVDGTVVTLGGMCKGSGMIHPNMCTMLGFLTTDLLISKELLQTALSETVQDTYNMVSVDGDTSTNDTVLLLSNGLAENTEIVEKDENYDKFVEALLYVNTVLSKLMAGDGEGATALIEAQVINAKSKQEAKLLAKSIICSSLTKAAIFGHDANWGRILCAMGYSGAEFDPEQVELFFQSVSGRIKIYGEGTATDYSEEDATKILSDAEVVILADMKSGEAKATAWGCDLTYDYIKINADYRS